MELLGAKQVSEMLGVPVGTLRYWRHSDIGPASFTLGRRVVYRREEVVRWIAERENATRRGGGDAALPATCRETQELSRDLSFEPPGRRQGKVPTKIAARVRALNHCGRGNTMSANGETDKKSVAAHFVGMA